MSLKLADFVAKVADEGRDLVLASSLIMALKPMHWRRQPATSTT
jgi:hypothetical protein